jgi:RimJ/RimL family protein N-acetyltransferase
MAEMMTLAQPVVTVALDIFITLGHQGLVALNLSSDTRAMSTTVAPRRITLRSGHRVLVRALRPDDGPGLAEAFAQLSETSRYRRFFALKPHLSEQWLAYLTDVDHRDHEALVAVAPGSGQLVGVARFIRNPREPDVAEVAVTVIDSWQRRGLGTALLRKLAQRAAEEGIRYFAAEILAENQPMLTLAHRLGDAETTHHGDTVSARIDLGAATDEAGTSRYDGYDLLRAAARGEFIGLPAVLREWLDLSEKIIASLLVPVSAFWDASGQAAPTAPAPGRSSGLPGEDQSMDQRRSAG